MTILLRARTMLTVAALLSALSACSGADDPGAFPEPAEILAIAPLSPEVWPEESLQFQATSAFGNEAIAWAVLESDGGDIDQTGVYTAPTNEGTFTVAATSAATTKTTQVRVVRNVRVTVTPEIATVGTGGSVTLAAAVTGSAKGVVWSVAEGDAGGSVSDAGVYTAPQTAGTYHVVATSAIDGSRSDSAEITVTAAAQPPPPPPPPPPPVSDVGAGTSHGASNITGVTGGGAMPSWTTNVVTAQCAGDGVTDDTACLQAAANAARSQGRPLVIPATSSYYRISSVITVYGSIGGVGGRPTLRQVNTAGTGAAAALKLAPGMTGWVYNLHLVGTHNGSNATGEWAHNIDLGSVSGVTIKGNLLENAMGDGIGTDASAFDGGTSATNVLIDGNTFRNPRRCAVALVWTIRRWVITNNLIDKQVNYVSGIDFEPERGTSVVDIEIAYNKFVMNNRVNPGGAGGGANGTAVFGWQVDATPNPGGNYYIHHNYGTFGTGFGSFTCSGTCGWYNVVRTSNVEGNTVPN